VGEAPANVQDVASLAAACLTLAEVTSDLDEAEHCCREAQQIYEHLERNDPTREPIYRSDLSEYAPLAGPLLLRSASGPFHRRALAAVHAALGDIALRRGDAHAAEQRQRLALELRQQVARDAPDEPANIAVLATSHAALADLLLEIGEPAGALEHGRLALEGHRRLSQADPDDVGWRRWLLKDYERLLATPAETPAPEIADWQAQAAALREQPPGR
jgi:tetratricopeptide (TPR) repeat protein